MAGVVPAGFGLEPYSYFAGFVEGRRGEILDAALAVFGEKGYEAGTLREIARRIGVTEPALYRHYESKEAILGDMVATAGDRIFGEMRKGLGLITGDTVVPMLHAFIEMRRRGADAKKRQFTDSGLDSQPAGLAPGTLGPNSGAGDVLHILMHAAPHNATFIGLLRTHLGQPMAEALRSTIPRVDADFGIDRSAENLESQVRIFMSLFVGYFTTSLLLDSPPNDDAVVDAILAIMGWTAS